MKYDFITDGATKRTTFNSLDEVPFERSGSVGGQHLRSELRGVPGFKGFHGPMWGGHRNEAGDYVFDGTGEPHVRYESYESYDVLSSGD